MDKKKYLDDSVSKLHLGTGEFIYLCSDHSRIMMQLA